MTDLADRAITRLTEIDETIRLLEYERDEISTALRVLSSFLEPDSAAPATLPDFPGTEPAKHAAEEPSSDGSGGMQDRCESIPPTFPPSPVDPGAADGDPADTPLSEAAPREAAASAAPETIPLEEEPPALSKRQQVRITAEDHPDWTAAQVAEHLGLTDGSVRGHASALGIKFAPAPAGTAVPRASSSLTKTDRVRLLHEQHPTWTARMLALELGEKESSVSTMLAIVRKQARAQAEPKPEFGSEQEMLQHYGDVAARLGKAK